MFTSLCYDYESTYLTPDFRYITSNLWVIPVSNTAQKMFHKKVSCRFGHIY